MASWISGNRYLSNAESDNNVICMYNFLSANYNWTVNAIAAVAGNFYGESGINPGIWQNLDEGNTSLGLGIGQWTPATKLLTWASETGHPWADGDSQCIFLNDNAGQWHSTNRPGTTGVNPPVTWDEFKTSTESVETLTKWFYWYWEDPSYSDTSLPTRLEKAVYYYELLSGRPPQPPEPKPGAWGRKMKTALMGSRWPF